MKTVREFFGEHGGSGAPVYLYRLENGSGAYVEVMNFGCRVRSIVVPGKGGALTDVCLGYDALRDYEADTSFQGAAIGRFANRIGGACFTLDGKTYSLEKNDGDNHLHGGSVGFHGRVWDVKCVAEEGDAKVVFHTRLPDGDAGYPGALDVDITYSWSESNELSITYEAVAAADTVVNFTNHTYFNLEGPQSMSVLRHELWLASTATTESDSDLLPTGRKLPAADTPFDFTTFKQLGADIGSKDLREPGGYDHNFILDGEGFRKVAILRSPQSGIGMTVRTDQPAMQLYTANMIKETFGKQGQPILKQGSVCLETQHHPNAPNEQSFPSTRLKQGEHFTTRTSYKFGSLK
jgi:aldose 1-epimerase